MAIVIESNKDMPACLNTDTKQKRVARQIAEIHFKKPIKSVNGPRIQGFFSRTMFVTFTDKSEIVLQFRPEPLDMRPFRDARQTLGTVVPEIEMIHSEDLIKDGITTYYMTKMEGSTWSSAVAGKKPTALPIINKSIGEIFANGYLEDTSATVVEECLRPHLKQIVDSTLPHIKPFRSKAKELLTNLDKLADLPLWVTHYDLNDMNILLHQDFSISGIIDWELSFPQPFGVFLGRIHTLAGEYSDGDFYERPEFETSERALWTALYEGIAVKERSRTVYKVILDNPELVQLAVEVGTILDAFQLEHGKLMEESNPLVIKSLPKFFSYRIPALRGNAHPYSE